MKLAAALIERTDLQGDSEKPISLDMGWIAYIFVCMELLNLYTY